MSRPEEACVHKPDFEPFREMLNTLADVFTRKPLDDAQVQAYWNALRDLSLEAVQHGAAYHTRYGKHFPRPVELRPRDDKPSGAPESGDVIAQADRAAARWAERTRAKADPLAHAALQDAAWSRKLATTDEDHPAYAEILRHSRFAADRHLALLRGKPFLRALP